MRVGATGHAREGLDEGDSVMRQTVTYRITQAFYIAQKRGRIGKAGKRKGATIWAIRLA